MNLPGKYDFHLFLLALPLVVFFIFSARIPLSENTVKSPDDLVKILHYNLSLDLSDPQRGTLRGVSDIQAFTLRDSVRTINLMLATGLKVDTVWVDEERVTFQRKGQFLKIFLPEPEEKGSTVLLTLLYHGTPARDPLWGGFYFIQGHAFNMGVGMNILPHPFGRAWYPCKDNFTDKATYDYFITVPDTMAAACPGTLQQVIPNHDGTQTFHWNLSDPIPTYLSAVSVASYAVLTDTLHSSRGILPAMYFVAPENRQNARITFSHVPRYLSVFEKYFGPYRWEKIGYATVPFPRGAMEHATCIFVPEYTVDGTFDHENLLVHEFSHNWFGNLVTCRSAGDMWLNEGWATYCETLYDEATQGRKSYLKHIKHLHHQVLQFAHIRDHGYFSIANVPPRITYGATVYEKGADIVHTLRNYLGDELFFSSMKKYLDRFAFQNVSTEDLERFLKTTTHLNIPEFFNTWVYTPGFPHFRIDSSVVIHDGQDYIIGLFFRQALKGRTYLSNNVKLRVTLLDPAWEEHDFYVTVSGSRQRRTLITSFPPLAIMLNTDQYISDATTSARIRIRSTVDTFFSDCLFRFQAVTQNDSAYIRIVHHWVGPDPPDFRSPAMIPVGPRYWSVEGILPPEITATGYFYYNFSHSLRNGFLDTLSPAPPSSSLRLLYRRGPGKKWNTLPSQVRGNAAAGYLECHSLSPGDYCIVSLSH